MRSRIGQFFFRNSIHKFGKVEPFALSKKVVRSTQIPDYLQNTPKPKAKAIAKRVRFAPTVRDAVAETTMIGSQASVRSALRSPTHVTGQHRGQSLAIQMNLYFGRETEAYGKGHPPLTAHNPNDYLGFPDDWKANISPKASADAVARFDRLRNSLDHYAPEFATNKLARDLYRANYAEMRALFFKLNKVDRYMPSPHDAETW